MTFEYLICQQYLNNMFIYGMFQSQTLWYSPGENCIPVDYPIHWIDTPYLLSLSNARINNCFDPAGVLFASLTSGVRRNVAIKWLRRIGTHEQNQQISCISSCFICSPHLTSSDMMVCGHRRDNAADASLNQACFKNTSWAKRPGV